MARYRENDYNEEPNEPKYRPRRMRDEEPMVQVPAKGRHSLDAADTDLMDCDKPKKKKSRFVLWILLIVAIIAFLVSGFMVLWELVLLPAQNDGTNDEIRAIAGVPADAEQTTSQTTVDFDALRAVNSDIIGWIRIANTVVDYPVLQSSEDDPQYYLYRDYKKQDTKYGSVFMEAKNTLNTGESTARSLTLHGHHMNDGRMFADILKYADLEFYKSTPVFTFDTYKEAGQWKVISVFKTNVLPSQGEVFQYIRTGFTDDNDFLDYVYQLRIRSIINTGVSVNEKDQLVVLSTCSDEYDNFRTVVVARKVRENEDTSVNTEQASYNSAPLYPDCWYQRGGSKPSYPATFKEARAQGQTSWYDGSLE